jgi:hypothetical protein
MKRSDEDELQFCQELIEADRSNFSAWHYRSVLLPRVHAARGHQDLAVLQQREVAKDSLATDAGAVLGTERARIGFCGSTGTRQVQGIDERLRGGSRGTRAQVVSTALAKGAPLIPLYELKAEFDFLHKARRSFVWECNYYCYSLHRLPGNWWQQCSRLLDVSRRAVCLLRLILLIAVPSRWQTALWCCRQLSCRQETRQFGRITGGCAMLSSSTSSSPEQQ